MRKITRGTALAEGWYEPNERDGLCYCGCGAKTWVAAQGSRADRLVAGEPARYIRGHIRRVNNPTKTHGLTGTPEHKAWLGARERCRPGRQRYANWGGRGIEVCSRWRDSFENFLADMGPKPSPTHSLDRIDNDGPYAPENCRWATPVEQRHNQRRCAA